ncbi:NADH dehydrogenase [ubiquinone] 1 alpha subcomplex subunit 11 isoform X2 [Vanacampus margaritifer]
MHWTSLPFSREASQELSSLSLLAVLGAMGYWDVPDGTDCVQKTWITTKVATTIAAMGAIFGMTTCLTAQVRDAPDEPVNYFVGGCASGIFLGARTHSITTGASACLGLGVLAFFGKVAKLENWRLIGPPKL